MIDTHAHIFAPVFEEDIDVVIADAKAGGIEKILLPNIDLDSIEPLIRLRDRYPEVCYAMLGLHPCSVNGNFNSDLKKIEKKLSDIDIVAIGEMGTDLYWDKTYWKEQQEAFKIQCEWAISLDLPIVIHSRDSINETIDLVKPFIKNGLKGVFHCFTGDLNQANQITDLGFYLGLGGVITFKNGGMDKVVPYLKKEYIVLETDSPYLAPTPYRGKRNTPFYLTTIAEKLSKLLNLQLEEVDSLTTLNAKTLFKLN